LTSKTLFHFFFAYAIENLALFCCGFNFFFFLFSFLLQLLLLPNESASISMHFFFNSRFLHMCVRISSCGCLCVWVCDLKLQKGRFICSPPLCHAPFLPWGGIFILFCQSLLHFSQSARTSPSHPACLCPHTSDSLPAHFIPFCSFFYLIHFFFQQLVAAAGSAEMQKCSGRNRHRNGDNRQKRYSETCQITDL